MRAILGLAALAMSAFATAATAAGSGFFAGPAEEPPAGYADRTYVDSEGCVFLRADYNGKTEWVPRVDGDRNPVCGQTPTFAASTDSTAAPTPEPEVAVTPEPAAVVAESRPRYTRPAGSGTVNRLSTSNAVRIPRGYRAAWEDGRLNPLRGPRTAAGNAQMASSFDTTKVPMVPPKVPAEASAVVASPAVTQPATRGYFVDLGSYPSADQAQAARARVQAAGMPASTRPSPAGQTLLVGPFASAEDATSAYNQLRRAGMIVAR